MPPALFPLLALKATGMREVARDTPSRSSRAPISSIGLRMSSSSPHSMSSLGSRVLSKKGWSG